MALRVISINDLDVLVTFTASSLELFCAKSRVSGEDFYDNLPFFSRNSVGTAWGCADHFNVELSFLYVHVT